MPFTRCMPLTAEERFITLASTTSTERSGPFPRLPPKFEGATGIAVRVVAGREIDARQGFSADARKGGS